MPIEVMGENSVKITCDDPYIRLWVYISCRVSDEFMNPTTIRKGNRLFMLLFFLYFWVHGTDYLHAQQKDAHVLRGIIYNAMTKKPVSSGTVFITELKKKENCDNNGQYRVVVPKPGTYTVFVRSEGLKVSKVSVYIENDTIKNFPLQSVVTTDDGLTITGRRDLQNVSRHSMTKQQIKQVPASFGDSINALASLPGVIRTGGDFFGPIVIRGGDYRGVRYMVDDIPIYNALHYGGLHSVINTNLIDEIDLYSSAFPAEIGSATSAVISMNTVDDVKEFGGYTDLSLLSATALIQTPILKNENGGIYLGSPLEAYAKEQRNAGYIIAAGRISYIDLIILPLVNLITGDSINILPQYWDYQFKARYNFNNAHSLTLLAFGSKDYLKFVSSSKVKTDGSDPLLTGLSVNTNQMTNGQSLCYTYQPSEIFKNRLTFYSSLRQNSISITIPAPGVNLAQQAIRIRTRPYVFGFTDKFRIVAAKKYLEIRGGAEYTIYNFTASGNRPKSTGGSFTSDLSNNNDVTMFMDNNILNHGVGGYVEAKFTYGGFTFVPGYRSDYLDRSGYVTWDPRGMMSYEFPTNTTISIAGGKYSYFFQTNSDYFDASPQYAKVGKNGKPEWAIHRVVGFEQAIGLFKIKAEGFWNDFNDLVQEYVHIGPDGSIRQTMSTGRIRAYGGEIMVKKDRKEGENGIFGWVSYTYTRSKAKSGLPHSPGKYGILISNSGGAPSSLDDIAFNKAGDYWGNHWLNYDFEQNHSFKLILGYAHGRHSITGKFMLYTSNPFTPIVASIQDPDYPARFIPVFGKPNTRNFPIYHRLDLRYSNTTTYTWGYVSWYIEVINAYNYRPIVVQRWNYNQPYLGKRNPKITTYGSSIALIPNFGVEVKF